MVTTDSDGNSQNRLSSADESSRRSMFADEFQRTTRDGSLSTLPRFLKGGNGGADSRPFLSR
jgi:hypothetical protein